MNPTFLQAQIVLHIARANWWTVYANTPANLARMIKRGGACDHHPYLMAHELIDDAMNTANTHLKNAQETLDQLNLLLNS